MVHLWFYTLKKILWNLMHTCHAELTYSIKNFRKKLK